METFELQSRFERQEKKTNHYRKFFCFKSKEASDNQSIKSHYRLKQFKFTPGVSIRDVLVNATASISLIVGLFIFSMTLWSFSRKITTHRLFMEFHLDYTFFLIPVGLLCIPAIVLTLLIKHHKLSYILWLFAIQIIASALLFTALAVGTSYKLNYSNKTEHLISTIPTQELNFTLNNLYSENDSATIDLLQQKFKCSFQQLCLRSIQEDVAWHRNIAVALCQLFISMYFFNASMVATIYTSDHFKLKRSSRR